MFEKIKFSVNNFSKVLEDNQEEIKLFFENVYAVIE
jgi:hypothetical protein